MNTTMRLAKLGAERRAYKAAAERHEVQAAAALERGHREAWEHFAREADLAWQMNAYVVGEIDRLTAGDGDEAA